VLPPHLSPFVVEGEDDYVAPERQAQLDAVDKAAAESAARAGDAQMAALRQEEGAEEAEESAAEEDDEGYCHLSPVTLLLHFHFRCWPAWPARPTTVATISLPPLPASGTALSLDVWHSYFPSGARGRTAWQVHFGTVLCPRLDTATTVPEATG